MKELEDLKIINSPQTKDFRTLTNCFHLQLREYLYNYFSSEAISLKCNFSSLSQYSNPFEYDGKFFHEHLMVLLKFWVKISIWWDVERSEDWISLLKGIHFCYYQLIVRIVRAKRVQKRIQIRMKFSFYFFDSWWRSEICLLFAFHKMATT